MIGGCGFCTRPRMVVGFLDREITAPVCRFFLRPHRLDQLDSVAELLEPLPVRRIRISVCVIFGTLPSGTQTENQPPVTDLIECRSNLGEHRRRPK
jgi:hypothetical protein